MTTKLNEVKRKALQSGVSVFICYTLYALLNKEDSFYAIIAAVIASQTDAIESLKVGQKRIYGTFIGAVIGIVFAMIFRGNALLCGIGVSLIIYVCNKAWGSPATNVACIAFIAIMLNIRPGDTPLEYGFNRFVDTFFGVAVSVITSYILFENPIINKIKDKF